MNENTAGRQILYGYIREHLFMSPREHADMVNQMAKLAERDGYHLAKVFTEKMETVPQAFETLVQAVIDTKVEAIILRDPAKS